MTNEEKAKELAGMENGINPIPAQRFVFDKCCEMAKWKDKQFENIIEYVETCYGVFSFNQREKFVDKIKKLYKGEES